MPFSRFKLHSGLLRAVRGMKFEKPTPVQEEGIPPALEGADVLGSAQTGSGKTLAFSLPLLHHLLSEQSDRSRLRTHVRAIVLAPVRELAAQVETTIRGCACFTDIRCALVIGGASMRPQTQALRSGVDIVVATPGRLLDHLRNTRGFNLNHCRFTVLDEADRMLDMGFLPDVSRILAALPSRRQTLMFSATVPKEVERLVTKFMKDPVRIQIDPPRKPAEGIIQHIYPVTTRQKYDLLFAMLETLNMESVLVFTATKRRADIVAGFLKRRSVSATAMHSDLSQSARTKTMQGFRDRRYRVLVATDIAARGLDIRHVSHVINYDVPLYPEDYLHRIGRTGRVFAVGDAITLMGAEEKKAVAAIERFIGKTIPRRALEGFPYDVPPRLEVYRPPAGSRFNLRFRRTFRKGRRGLL